MRGLVAMIAAASVWAQPVPALAYCSEPSLSISVPNAPGTFDKPDVPSCLSGFSYSREHTCESWEIESYKGEVEDYIRKLNGYVEETVTLANRVRQFAMDAQDYAACESKDALSQHE
jgi:hypothetical protein